MTNGGNSKKKKWGCIGCGSCLGLLLILAVVVVAAAILAPDLFRRIGIRGPDAEERYSGAMDPVGTEMITGVLTEAGFERMDVVVMPVKGSDGQIAIITLNESSRLGSLDSSATGEEQFHALIRQFSQANGDGNLNIETVAVNLEGDDGESLVAISAPQEAIDAFAAGEISRREFVRQVEIDYSNLISPAEIQQLIKEMEVAQ